MQLQLHKLITLYLPRPGAGFITLSSFDFSHAPHCTFPATSSRLDVTSYVQPHKKPHIFSHSAIAIISPVVRFWFWLGQNISLRSLAFVLRCCRSKSFLEMDRADAWQKTEARVARMRRAREEGRHPPPGPRRPRSSAPGAVGWGLR